MKKKKLLKYISISIISVFIILIILVFIHPVIFHFDCYAGEGRWITCSSGCGDFCDSQNMECPAMIMPCCDCGPDKCWDGKKCVPNEEKYCEIDKDCLSSCGAPTGFIVEGTGCFNRDYVIKVWNQSGQFIGSGTSPIDGECCICDDASRPFECVCKKNICTLKKIHK